MTKENVLIIGSGGREHAIGKKISESPHVNKVYFARGNGGTKQIGENIKIGENDFLNLIKFAKDKKIALTIVGPEQPLAYGITDVFEAANLRIFGPTRNAARLESDKAFTKEFLRNNAIPTARFEIFADSKKAYYFAENTADYPCVIKASGLASGKGVKICNGLEDVATAIQEIMVDKKFGNSGNQIVFEDFLEGSEFSVLGLTDGNNLETLIASQDHKQAFNWDFGPNTGGMGAYAPYFPAEKKIEEIKKKIMRPTLDAAAKDGFSFKGCLYLGGMLTADGPKVIEYNVRFGDPETQPVLSLLENDLYEIMSEIADGKLTTKPVHKNESAVCIVLASRGYPKKYPKGLKIKGLPVNIKNVTVYHAGTMQGPDREFYTTGGRVLGVTATGIDKRAARESAYDAVREITIPGGFHYRDDIALNER